MKILEIINKDLMNCCNKIFGNFLYAEGKNINTIDFDDKTHTPINQIIKMDNQSIYLIVAICIILIIVIIVIYNGNQLDIKNHKKFIS
jgi:hypothetical protein